MIDIVTRLRAMGYAPYHEHQVMQEAADEIDRLRAERDRLRRCVCEGEAELRGRDARAAGMSDWFHSSKQIAAEYGWDCFGVTKCQSPATPTDETSQEDGA